MRNLVLGSLLALAAMAALVLWADRDELLAPQSAVAESAMDPDPVAAASSSSAGSRTLPGLFEPTSGSRFVSPVAGNQEATVKNGDPGVIWQGRTYSWRAIAARTLDGGVVRSSAPGHFDALGMADLHFFDHGVVVDGFDAGKLSQAKETGTATAPGPRLELLPGLLLTVVDFESGEALLHAVAEFGWLGAGGRSETASGILQLPSVASAVQMTIKAPGYQSSKVSILGTEETKTVKLKRGMRVRFFADTDLEKIRISILCAAKEPLRIDVGSDQRWGDAWIEPGSYTAVLEQATDAWGGKRMIDTHPFVISGVDGEGPAEIHLSGEGLFSGVTCEVLFSGEGSVRPVSLHLQDESGTRVQSVNVQAAGVLRKEGSRFALFERVKLGTYNVIVSPDLTAFALVVTAEPQTEIVIDLSAERIAHVRAVDADTGALLPHVVPSNVHGSGSGIGMGGGRFPLGPAEHAEGTWVLRTTNPSPHLRVEAAGYKPWWAAVSLDPGINEVLIELVPAHLTWLHLTFAVDGVPVEVSGPEIIECLSVRDSFGVPILPDGIYSLGPEAGGSSHPELKYYHAGEVLVALEGLRGYARFSSKALLSADGPAELAIELEEQR